MTLAIAGCLLAIYHPIFSCIRCLTPACPRFKHAGIGAQSCPAVPLPHLASALRLRRSALKYFCLILVNTWSSSRSVCMYHHCASIINLPVADDEPTCVLCTLPLFSILYHPASRINRPPHMSTCVGGFIETQQSFLPIRCCIAHICSKHLHESCRSYPISRTQ